MDDNKDETLGKASHGHHKHYETAAKSAAAKTAAANNMELEMTCKLELPKNVFLTDLCFGKDLSKINRDHLGSGGGGGGGSGSGGGIGGGGGGNALVKATKSFAAAAGDDSGGRSGSVLYAMTNTGNLWVLFTF